MSGYGQSYDDLRVPVSDDKLGIALVALPALFAWGQMALLLVGRLVLPGASMVLQVVYIGAFLIAMAILAMRDAPRWRMEGGSSFLFILLLFVVGYPVHMANRAKRGAPLGLGAGLGALALMFLPLFVLPAIAASIGGSHTTAGSAPDVPAVVPSALPLSPKAVAAAAEHASENTDQATCNANECTVGILGAAAKATLSDPKNAGKLIVMESPTEERFATLASFPGIIKLKVHALHREPGKALVTDIGALGALTELRELELWQTGNTDLKALAPLGKLEALRLYNTQELSSLEGLASLVSLKSLEVKIKGIGDLSPLGALTNLETLKISFGSNADLTPLSKLTSLKTLEFTYFDHQSLAQLGSISSLRTLEINSTQPQSDWASLGKLTGLESLTVYGPVADISFVSTLAHLTRATFIGSKQLVNVAPLGKLAGLENLNLEELPLADIAPLAGCTHLKWLYLRRTKVTNVAPLASLKELGTLKIAEAPGVDPMPLAKMTGLKSLTVSAKDVPDAQIQAFKAAAPGVKVVVGS